MSDIRKLFDQAIAITALHLKNSRWKEKKAEADQLLIPRCGNCEHWMRKDSCPREAAGDKPSRDYPSCEKYQMNWITPRLYQQKIAELDN